MKAEENNYEDEIEKNMKITRRNLTKKEKLENQELKDAKTKIENKGQHIANFLLDTYCENKTKENEEKEIEEKILALEKEKIRSEIFEMMPQMKTMLDLLNEITDESKSKTLEQVEELYQKFCEIKNSKDTAKTVDKLRPKFENPQYD